MTRSVWVRIFRLWAWCCLSTGVTARAALHDAGRADVGIFSPDVRTCTAHLSAVGTYYLFTQLLGSMLPLFYSWSWRSTAHFNAVGIVCTYGHNSDNTARSTSVEATVPLQCGRWANCFVWALY